MVNLFNIFMFNLGLGPLTDNFIGALWFLKSAANEEPRRPDLEIHHMTTSFSADYGMGMAWIFGLAPQEFRAMFSRDIGR